jgi:hypothetical protein
VRQVEIAIHSSVIVLVQQLNRSCDSVATPIVCHPTHRGFDERHRIAGPSRRH